MKARLFRHGTLPRLLLSPEYCSRDQYWTSAAITFAGVDPCGVMIASGDFCGHKVCKNL
jgi:hypothetical protein